MVNKERVKRYYGEPIEAPQESDLAKSVVAAAQVVILAQLVAGSGTQVETVAGPVVEPKGITHTETQVKIVAQPGAQQTEYTRISTCAFSCARQS